MNRKIFILLALLWGIFVAASFISSTVSIQSSDTIYFSEIIIRCGLPIQEIVVASLIDMLIRMLPYFIFQIFYGITIYQHFCIASVYYFSRCTNRISWFLKEAAKLYIVCFGFVTIIPLSSFCASSMFQKVEIDGASLILFFYHILIYSAWLYGMTLVINIISIKAGSNIGFFTVACFEALCTGFLELWDTLLSLDSGNNIARNSCLLQLNPIAHLVLNWHSSIIESVNEKINYFSIRFDLNFSVFLFWGVCALFLALGCYFVEKHELLLSNAETGV